MKINWNLFRRGHCNNFNMLYLDVVDSVEASRCFCNDPIIFNKIWLTTLVVHNSLLMSKMKPTRFFLILKTEPRKLK